MSLSKTLVLFAEKKLSPNLDHAPVLREQFWILKFNIIYNINFRFEFHNSQLR